MYHYIMIDAEFAPLPTNDFNAIELEPGFVYEHCTYQERLG